jgi:hypothetical protein
VGISKLTGSPPRGPPRGFWEVAILNESYWMNQIILLEFCSGFSDVLHVTGNNKSINIGILEKTKYW